MFDSLHQNFSIEPCWVSKVCVRTPQNNLGKILQFWICKVKVQKIVLCIYPDKITENAKAACCVQSRISLAVSRWIFSVHKILYDKGMRAGLTL